MSTTVSDAMSVRFPFAHPDTTLPEAAAMIQMYDWQPLPVKDDSGHLAGVVTEHDITRAVADRCDFATTRAANVAESELPTLAPDTSLEDAAQTMRRAG